MRALLICMICTLAMGEEVKGRLINGTNNGPAKADSLQLIVLGDQMTVLGTLENIEGDFSFDTEVPLDGKNILLQANKDGVLYSESLKWPVDQVTMTLYDSADEVPLETSIGSMALYAFAESMDIGIFYNINNTSDPAVTLNNENGSFHFELIPGYTGLQASTRRGTLPLRQNLKVADNRASLMYPLRPGETQLMVRARYTYDQERENTYTLTLPNKQGLLKVLALPRTLELKGEGVTFVAEDPKDNMKLYEFQPEAGRTELTVTVSGIPLDKPVDPLGNKQETGDTQQTSSHAAASEIKRRPHFLDAWRYHIIAGILVLLGAISFVGLRR